MLLEVLSASSHELDGSKLEAFELSTLVPRFMSLVNLPAVLEASDDGADESTLKIISMSVIRSMYVSAIPGHHLA